MTKEALLKSAKEIKQVSEELANEYASKRSALVEKMNEKMLKRLDLKEMVSENNIDMMKDNHANHARFLESIFYNYSPEVLVDSVLWVFRAYRSRNFHSTYWSAQLNSWLEIYNENLSNDCFIAIYPYYNWMLINIPTFIKLAENEIDTPQPMH